MPPLRHALVSELGSGGGTGVASAVTFSSTGTISSTNVQAAIAEVAVEAEFNLDAHLANATSAHNASAISFTPTGQTTSTNIQDAIAEVAALAAAGGGGGGGGGVVIDPAGGSVVRFTLFHTGQLAVTTEGDAVKPRTLPMPFAGTIVSVVATIDDVADNIVRVDLNRKINAPGATALTMFTTQANRPTIPTGSVASQIAVPDVTQVAVGDALSVNIDDKGSSLAPGAELAVWVTILTADPINPPASPGVVNFFRSGDATFDVYTSAPSGADITFMNDHYDIMRVNSPYFDTRLSWFPNAIAYKDAYAIYVGQALAAAHPEWILRDNLGNPLYIPFGTPGAYQQYAGDITHPAFRANWISEASAVLSHGYIGLLIDDANYLKRVGTSTGVETGTQIGLAGTLTLAMWQTAMADFMTEIRQAFPGKLLIQNVYWHVTETADIVRGYDQADGIEKEAGVVDAGITGGTGTFSLRALLDWADRRHLQGNFVVWDSTADTTVEREYGRACYFLTNDGTDMLGSRVYGTPDDWWTGYDIDLGAPLAAREVLASGLLHRSFANGDVYVNEPGHASVTVAGVTLAGGTGAIVLT